MNYALEQNETKYKREQNQIY